MSTAARFACAGWLSGATAGIGLVLLDAVYLGAAGVFIVLLLMAVAGDRVLREEARGKDGRDG